MTEQKILYCCRSDRGIEPDQELLRRVKVSLAFNDAPEADELFPEDALRVLEERRRWHIATEYPPADAGPEWGEGSGGW